MEKVTVGSRNIFADLGRCHAKELYEWCETADKSDSIRVFHRYLHCLEEPLPYDSCHDEEDNLIAESEDDVYNLLWAYAEDDVTWGKKIR